MRRGVLLIGVVVAGVCLVLLAVTDAGHRSASPASRVIAVDPGVGLLNPDGSLRTHVPTGQIGKAYDALYRNGLFVVLARDPDGSLWMGGAHGAVDHIDLPAQSIGLIRLGGRNYSIAVDGGHHLWTTDVDTGTVYELNEHPAVIARYATASGADSVAYGDGAAWV